MHKDAVIPPGHVYLFSPQPQTMPVHTWKQNYSCHPFVKIPGELLQISEPDERQKHRRCASPWVPWAHIWWFRIVMLSGALYSYICYVLHNLMGVKGSRNHVWIWRVTPPLADERETTLIWALALFPREQSRGCFSLPRAAVELSVTTWLCTSFIRTLSVFWYMSHFIPYNSCTSPTLGLRGLAFSITLVIIFMTLLQYFFSSDMPSAQGTGLLLKGYRYDRWDCDSNVWCTALLGHRQNVCVCFTFVKLLLIPTGKASPAGSFLLSIPSLSALAMKEPCLGESLLGQGERNREPGQKGDPFHMCFPYTWICCFPLHPRQKMGGGGEISSTYW